MAKIAHSGGFLAILVAGDGTISDPLVNVEVAWRDDS